jgi:hypothetical protein
MVSALKRAVILVLVSAAALVTTAGPAAAAEPTMWTPGTSYPVGAQVFYGTTQSGGGSIGAVYECRQAHTAQVGWEPPSVPALWQRPTPIDCFPWAPQTAYKTNGLVMFNGQAYKCLQGHNSEVTWTPAAVPALWSAVSNSQCSTAKGDQLSDAFVNPAHFSGLSVNTQNTTTTATFTSVGHTIKAAFTYSSPETFNLVYSILDSTNTYKKFGEVSNSARSLNSTLLASFGISGTGKETLILSITEVLAGLVTEPYGLGLNPALGGCDKLTVAVQKGVFGTGRTLMNDISSYGLADTAETLSWGLLGGTCGIEAKCMRTVRCKDGGSVSCEASAGKINTCEKIGPGVVLCTELDKNGKEIGRSISTCGQF